MKLKIYLAILIAATIINNATAQNFEWAYEFPVAIKGTNAGAMTTDRAGNLIAINHSHFCQVCATSAITKSDPAGNVIFGLTTFTGTNYSFNSVATDYAGNIFVSGSHDMGTFSIGNFSTTSHYWFFKLDPSGNVQWLHKLNNFFYMTVDSAGNQYFTNNSIHHTFKLTKNNVLAWTDTLRGGVDIGVDRKYRCYIVTDTSTVRYDPFGKVLYTKNVGGNKISVNKNGSVYVLSSSRVTYLRPDGIIGWINSSITGSDIVSDSTNAYVVAGTQISKVKNNGSAIEWSISSQGAPFSNIAVDDNKNVYADGNYNTLFQTVLCPFQLTMLNSPVYSNFQSFYTKISGNTPVPYQLGIFTGDLGPQYANILCKNTPINNIPFTYCLNSASTLDPSNEFRVQISPDNFTSAIYDVGTPSLINIPNSVPAGNNYRVRVVSTLPAVNGYPNFSMSGSENITIRDNETTVTASGPLTFCQGSSITLAAVFQPYTTGVAWYNGLNFISNDTSIIVNSSGEYTCQFFNACLGESAPISVVVIPLPDASYTASGPLSFCAGDSVVFTANSGSGYTYHWRKNGFGLPGAFNLTYTARTAGIYNVKVTNPDGCIQYGVPVTVVVPCRQSEDGMLQKGVVNVFPQPVHDILNFDIQNFSGKVKLYIINELGQTVLSKEMDFDTVDLKSIDMSQYSPGLYTVIFKSSELEEMVRVVKE